MFDLHSHLLPGIDDGAKDWAMAMDMARVAYADGIRGLVFTPHNSAWWSGYYQEKVERLTGEFQERLRDAGLDLQVGPGAEVYCELDILKRLQDGRAATLNRSRYLLVELPFTGWPLSTEQVFFELQAAGYRPIMAHPERNSHVIDRPQLMGALAERGVLGQVTSGSLEGMFGLRAQKTAIRLLENRWSHIVASDAHDLAQRAPILRPAFEIARAQFGGERAAEMFVTLPGQIFRNEDVVLESPAEYEVPQPRSLLASLFRR